MLIYVGILLIIGWILYLIAGYYCRRYLAFQAIDHVPKYIPGASDTPSPSPPVLVCVLGWGGCTRRQLRRLLEFYAGQGIPTVSWINPMFNYLCGIDRKQVERVLDLLLHENQNAKQMIIHLHSNNGALVWGYMLQTMRTNEHFSGLLPNIRGIILDSAPFVRFGGASEWIIVSAVGASRACVGVILHRVQYFHALWTPLTSYYLYLRLFHQRYLSSDPSFPSEKVLRLLNDTPVQIKQCYLYSDGDRLIPPHVIEQFMAVQVERGVQVTSHRFKDSGHVNHFRLYPVEYGQLVLDFIVHSKNNALCDE